MSTLSVGLSAAIGGIVAMLADFYQKKDASAIYEFTGLVNKYSEQAIPVGAVALGLIVLSVILAYLQEARSRMSAFYAGASVLTVLMTLVPYDAPQPLPSGSTVNQVSVIEGGIISSAYAAETQMAQAGAQIPVAVVVKLPARNGAMTPRISGIVYDAVSGQKWQLGYTAPKTTTSTEGVTYRFDFVIQAGAPAGDKLADLRLRATAEGYQTATAQQLVTRAGQPVLLQVTLKPSSLPRFLQRTLESPQF
jgi:hypothetical protein